MCRLPCSGMATGSKKGMDVVGIPWKQTWVSGSDWDLQSCCHAVTEAKCFT